MEQATVALPVTWNFAKKDLKIIRLKEGLRYDRSGERPVLPDPGGLGSPVAEMDLYSRLQAVESAGGAADGKTKKASVKLGARHIALFDRTRIHDKLLARKRGTGCHNLTYRPRYSGQAAGSGRLVRALPAAGTAGGGELCGCLEAGGYRRRADRRIRRPVLAEPAPHVGAQEYRGDEAR